MGKGDVGDVKGEDEEAVKREREGQGHGSMQI